MFSTCCHWEIFLHIQKLNKIIKKRDLQKGNICLWRHIYFMQINFWHWMKFWWIQCLTNVIIFSLRVGRIIIITWCLISNSCCLNMNHHQQQHHPHHIHLSSHLNSFVVFLVKSFFMCCLFVHKIHTLHWGIQNWEIEKMML
jgi:hypothetical protein